MTLALLSINKKYSMYEKYPTLLGILTAVLAGFLVTLSFSPWFFWPLGILGVGYFWWLLQEGSPVRAFWRGWSFGFGLFASGVSWVYVSIADHSTTPKPLAVLMTGVFVGALAFFYAFFAVIYQRFIRKLPFGHSLGFASLWLLFEWFRSVFLTGFPWLFLGDAHLYSPLRGFAPIIGGLGIGFLVALVSTMLALCVKNVIYPCFAHQNKTMDQIPQPDALAQKQCIHIATGLTGIFILSIFVLGEALADIEWTHPVESSRPIEVAAIQGNVDQDYKWTDEAIVPTLTAYSRATALVASADLVVWPETAMTQLYHEAQPTLDALQEMAVHQQTNLITGIPDQHSPLSVTLSAYYNSVIGLGLASGKYNKQKLVPFGEYVPFADRLRGLTDFFDLPMSSFSRGKPNQSPLNIQIDDQAFNVAPFICYEIVYPNLVAKAAQSAELLVTLSNDAWFGRSIGPKQHLALAQMRSLETGRYQLRATNTGVTALIDHKGRIITELPIYEFASLQGKARLMSASTPFMVYGYWPSVGFCLLLLVFLWGLSILRIPASCQAEVNS